MLEENKISLTPVSDLGEFGLIERLISGFVIKDKNLLQGPGDDCAVYELDKGKCLLITTDLLIEGIHFDLSYVPLQHLGYKAVAVNLSDIFAMNGKPAGITVSVGMSNRFSVEAMDAFYLGVKACCEKYGVELLGGDTSTSKAGLFISIAAIGFCEKEKVVYRSGAKENDLICVSGDLGAAYAGLKILEREKNVFLKNPGIQPDLSGFEYCVGRQLKPEPAQVAVQRLEELGLLPTAMIDLSDGLASDLNHICRQSIKGAVVYQDKIPVDHETSKVADLFDLSPVTYALNGGEDYQLLFTLPVIAFEKIKSEKEIQIIGHITSSDRGVRLITSSGQELDIPSTGFKHF